MTRNMPALRRNTASWLLAGWVTILAGAALWIGG